MDTYSVRDAYQILKERGIARDKQEVRKWLIEGHIKAEPPINRRVGWKIDGESLMEFVARFEKGELDRLIRRRRKTLVPPGLGDPAAATDGEGRILISPHVVRLEEEVASLRQQVRVLRREMNDLKKVLGFPVLYPSDAPETARKTEVKPSDSENAP